MSNVRIYVSKYFCMFVHACMSASTHVLFLVGFFFLVLFCFVLFLISRYTYFPLISKGLREKTTVLSFKAVVTVMIFAVLVLMAVATMVEIKDLYEVPIAEVTGQPDPREIITFVRINFCIMSLGKFAYISIANKYFTFVLKTPTRTIMLRMVKNVTWRQHFRNKVFYAGLPIGSRLQLERVSLCSVVVAGVVKMKLLAIWFCGERNHGKRSVGGQARTIVDLLEADTGVPRDCLLAAMDDGFGWKKTAMGWEW